MEYFLIYNTAKVNYDLLNNFFIGYSKVEENEDGIKTVYEYTNDEEPNVQTRSYTPNQNYPNTIAKFIFENSSYGSNFYIDNSYKRGKLKYAYYYDKYSPNPIMKKENVYKGLKAEMQRTSLIDTMCLVHYTPIAIHLPLN